MSDEELLAIVGRLRRQGKDDASYEVKECASKLSKDIWETVSAFANTEGETFILGLSEAEGFTPVDNFDRDKVRDQFLSGMGDGGSRGRLVNPHHYAIGRAELQGGPLLVIQVDELDPSHKPCYITDRGVQGGSYRRVDDADMPLTAKSPDVSRESSVREIEVLFLLESDGILMTAFHIPGRRPLKR